MAPVRRGIVACVLAAALFASTAAAGTAGKAVDASAVLRATREYQALLERVEHASAAAPVESLFTLGTRTADALMNPSGATLSPLEQLSDSLFAEIVGRMRGFLVYREEGSFVQPDPSFFHRLAKAHGDSVDVAFFHGWMATRDSISFVWPSYVQQQTDEAGCTRFGSGALVSAYAVWNSFDQRYPERYVAYVLEELGAIEREVTEGTCACGGQEDMLRELRAFDQRFPNAAIGPLVRARIRTVQAGTSRVRFRCIAG